MAEKVNYLTADGRKKLEEELEYLIKVRRPQVAERIRQAKEGGDISENSAYDEAKNEQGFVEGRICDVEATLRDAVVLTRPLSTDKVQVGSRVTVVDNEGEAVVYHIVGSAEADPVEGRISNESPMGQALMGHRVGDAVSVRAPSGNLRFTIKAIG
ncbi:MAG TPA: transcription elongation factor GreA [Anaerolineae bacterium]|nr:transcription elongation factor GreA [Anaerolineae bacterium]HOQ97705.1 transcription elongation factor GreA [Anaerolineae bacterium]HPL26853.1 transcription elongation factor GreA [Anaerolineae bacterium]